MEAKQPFLSFVEGRNSTQRQYSGSIQCFYWRRQKKSVLGAQKSWLSGSSVSAIFLVITLCPVQPMHVRMWLTDRPKFVRVMCLFFIFLLSLHWHQRWCILFIMQYFVNIAQHEYYGDMLSFWFVFVFYFWYILIARLQLVPVLTSAETQLQYVHQKLSAQLPSTQCWVRTGWNFHFGWTTPF